MAETKRVSDQYKISSPSIVLDGNVAILGGATTVESVESQIKDNQIVINHGEIGAGVSTLGTTAGITVDRGSLPDVTLRWNEATDRWELTTDGINYDSILTASFSIATPDYSVQYVLSGNLQGETVFTYDPSANTLFVSNVLIGNNEITVANTNGNLVLSSNGTGTVNVEDVASLPYQGSTPGSTASRTKIYAATPGAGDSGLYFVNTVASNELISKNKALMMALIM